MPAIRCAKTHLHYTTRMLHSLALNQVRPANSNCIIVKAKQIFVLLLQFGGVKLACDGCAEHHPVAQCDDVEPASSVHLLTTWPETDWDIYFTRPKQSLYEISPGKIFSFTRPKLG